ncbi:MAG: gliding motility-associated C-terminal domain-containing protein [Chitinophagales bacterium]|nr:gliding motility-associated C-terminal domain-containing protein [Chitinophagales bacterium]
MRCFCLLLFFLLLLQAVSMAQTYSPVVITGFNSDLVAESAPNSLATTSMSTDLTAHVLYSETFAAGAGLAAGIVDDGTVVSGTRTYQMAPYNAANAVYVDVGQTKLITLFTTGSYAKISLMGFSAEGNSTLNIKLTFTDGSTSNYGNFTLSDWFNGANAVYCCFSRCIRTTAAPYNIDGLPSNPRFYPIDISLTCADQKKNLQTITIKNLNGTTGFTNAFILALSGVPYSQNIFAIPNDVTCHGGSDGSINLFVSGTAAPFTYSWNTVPPQTTVNATNLDSGTYVCTVTDINGCITYDTVTVSVLPSLPFSVQANPNFICAGSAAQLTVSGISSFTWMPGNMSASPVSVSPAVTTVYTVSGTDANGCTRQDSVTVAVNALPLITVNPNPASICSGGAIGLLASGGVSYSWSPATGLSSSTVANPTANPAATTVYTVTGIGANGCINSSTATVNVNSNPVVNTLADPAIICSGETSTLSVIGLNNFTWSPGSQVTSPINVSPATTTTYTVSGNDINGCSGQATVTVTVNPLPSVTSNPAAVAICAGDATTLTAAGGINYSWLPATGLNDPNVANPTANPAATTVYTVTGFNASGCSATATSTVTVYPAPIVNAVANPVSICEGGQAQLTVTGLSFFSWNPGGQTFSPVTVSPLNSTTYTVTGSDANGCNGAATVFVAVEPLPTVTATADDTLICEGAGTLLHASGTATQFAWSPGNLNGNSVTVFPTDTTLYSVTGILGNCIATDSVLIKVVASPSVAFYPSVLEGCEPLQVIFTDQSNGGIAWHWSFGDGDTSAAQNAAHTFDTGKWSVTETVSNAAGCSTTLVLTDLIQVYANPVADFSVAPAMNLPVELTNALFQFTNKSIGAAAFYWDFDDGTFSSEEDPAHRYATPGEYSVTLMATGTGDCSDTIMKSFVEVIPATIAFIPNAFTPNGDGLNDIFLPANMNLQALEMKIFNRWGNLIFQSTSKDTGWDGNTDGLPAEAGVYIYWISLEFDNGKNELRKGNLTLVR